ncbi:MAG TPA: polyhydroxyalkanoic acid system family protein [Thermoanaerobaculia bacterium]|nr:polyhydroxyalkanoic acid system family protein [Thermoanaerobaculia bacterium]
MRIAVPHNSTREKAKKIVEQRLHGLEKQYGAAASDLDYEWHGFTLHLSGKAKGMSLKGTIEITDTDLIVDGKLPLLARPFESRIRHTVEREAESMFRTA